MTQPLKTESAAGNETVLVIDDDEMVMEISQALLQRLGYKVLAAGNGHEAVNTCAEPSVKIDLAIMDVKLPDMDGLTLYEKLADTRPEMKVVVCSGYSVDGQAQSILDAGAKAFLQKPITVEALSTTIKKVLDGR
ncbi:MAG: response regulator transcription factor [Desulfobacteraceae bacterium]|nr:response regulator transcription factor [Desulfobacteraceae bacterium]